MVLLTPTFLPRKVPRQAHTQRGAPGPAESLHWGPSGAPVWLRDPRGRTPGRRCLVSSCSPCPTDWMKSAPTQPGLRQIQSPQRHTSVGHDGRWAQAGSSAQPGPCRVCSLKPGPRRVRGDLGSLTNSPSLCLHSHSGADGDTTPVRGGGRGVTRQETARRGGGRRTPYRPGEAPTL